MSEPESAARYRVLSRLCKRERSPEGDFLYAEPGEEIDLSGYTEDERLLYAQLGVVEVVEDDAVADALILETSVESDPRNAEASGEGSESTWL